MISYDFVALVSDFGGALGLFLGFSFFALWDIIKDCFIAVRRCLKKRKWIHKP